MRVLHVIPAVAERYGGPSIAVLRMSRGLRSRGVECLIATTDAAPSGRLPVDLGVITFFEGEPVIFHRRLASEAFKLSWGLAAWLRANVARFDLVHIHAVFSHACVSAGRACRAAGRPYVVRPLGTLDPWSLQQKALRKRLFWAIAAHRLLKGAASVHYTSRRERVRTEDRLGLEKGVVIPLAVAPEAGSEGPEPPTRSGAVVLLFLSRIHPKKNLPLLLHALDRVRRSQPGLEWRLVIAGDGEPSYVQLVRALVDKLELGSRVELRGWIGDDEKRAVLGGSGVVVLPSEQENFGIAVAEAMATGVPVIVSTGVDLADDVLRERAGWVCDAEIDSLVKALVDALASPRERLERGANARRFGQVFSMDRMTDGLISLYEAILRGERRFTV